LREILQRWLSRRPKCPGVVAWGLFFPDQGTFSPSLVDEASAEKLAPLWAELAEALREMPQHGAETSQMRWVFSQHQLYATARADGACLGILAAKEPDDAGRACIEKTLAEFRAIGASAAAR
jgi:hypothetical protein